MQGKWVKILCEVLLQRVRTFGAVLYCNDCITSAKIAYHNDPKFSDRYAWANSEDPDQTAPRGAVWSGSTLFAIPSASFGLITLW